MRVAMISMHTSPLEQPGIGDAGGMNVYVLESAKRLARRGVAVDVFTRRTTASDAPIVEVEPGVVGVGAMRQRHAGLEPEKGIHAGLELAHQMQVVAELADAEARVAKVAESGADAWNDPRAEVLVADGIEYVRAAVKAGLVRLGH